MAKKKEKGSSKPNPVRCPQVPKTSYEHCSPARQWNSNYPSPYVSPPVTLRIGPGLRSYHVSRDFLQNEDWLNSCFSWMPTASIELPDVEEDIGHTLVHYLYTSTYEMLDSMETFSGISNYINFKRAISVYAAAQTYHLPGLGRLAEKEADRLGADLDILDVVDAIGEHFRKSAKNMAWLLDYLKGRIDRAFHQDRTALEQTPLLERSSNNDLNCFIAQRVIGLYRDALVKHEDHQDIPKRSIPEAEEATFELNPVLTNDLTSINEDIPVEDPDPCLTPVDSPKPDPAIDAISSMLVEYANSMACHHRAQHLLDDQWKECRQCRAFLRHITVNEFNRI